MAAYQNNANQAPNTSGGNAPSGEPAWRRYSSTIGAYNQDFGDDDDELVAALTQNMGGQTDVTGNMTTQETTPGGYNQGLNQGNGISADGGVGLGGAPVADSSPFPQPGIDGFVPGEDMAAGDNAAAPSPYDGDPYDDIMGQLMGIIGGGVRDTSAEEGNIRDMYAGKMGAGMGDLAAQFGAGGMGQSGALLGAGADLQGQLSQQATQQIHGVQQGARDEYYRNLMNAVGASQNERYLGMDESQFGMLYDMLVGEMGAEDGSGQMGDEYAYGEDNPWPGFTDADGDGKDDVSGNAPDNPPGSSQGPTAMQLLGGFIGGNVDAFGGDGGQYVSSVGEIPNPDDYEYAGYSNTSGQHVYKSKSGKGPTYYVAGSR